MRVGEYELLEEVGRGGAGRVYRARARDGREVALKLLTARSPGAGARFLREQRLQGAFGAREGFVPLLDAGEDEQGRPFLVLPLLAGGTLRQRLSRGRLEVDEARGLGLALARALGAAHARGVVHRDVKPSNVLFDGQGRPFLADLGLARQFTAAAPERQGSVGSRTGDFRGTPGYMAPEQLLDAKRVGPPADVFALGVLLYEALSGQPAFSGPSLIDVALKVERGQFVPLRQVRADVPPWLAAAVERALDPDPTRRFPDGEALARALEAGDAPPARGDDAGPSPRPVAVAGRWSARRTLELSAGALALTGAALLGALARGPASAGPASAGRAGLGGEAESPVESEVESEVESAGIGAAPVPAPPRVTPGPAAPAPLPAELAAVWEGSGAPPLQVYGRYEGLFARPLFRVLPVGQAEVALVGPEEAGLGGPWVCDLEGRPRLRLDHPDSAAIAVSEDGQRLVSGGAGELRVWSLESGARLATLRLERPEVQAVALSAHGEQVLCASVPLSRDYTQGRAWDLSLEVWDVARGQVVSRLAGLPQDDVHLLAFLPAGEVVAVGTLGSVAVWRASDGQLLRELDVRLPAEKGAGRRGQGQPGVCVLAPGGGLLLCAYGPEDDAMRWFDLARGEPLGRETPPRRGWTHALAVGPARAGGGSEVVAAYEDGSVHLRVGPGEWRHVAQAESMPPLLALVGDRLVVGGRRLHALDPHALEPAGLGRGAPRRFEPPPAHLDAVHELALGPDGARLVSIDEQELIEWDARSGAPLLRHAVRDLRGGNPDTVRLLGPDGRRLLVGDETALALHERGAAGWVARPQPGRGEDVTGFALSRDGALVLEHLQAGFRRLVLDQPPGEPLGVLPRLYLHALAVTPDGRLAVLERSDETQELWDPRQGTKLRDLRLSASLQGMLATAADPPRVACGDHEGRVRIWELEGGTELVVLPPSGGYATALAFSPDGARLAVGDALGRLAVWSVAPEQAGAPARPLWSLGLGPCRDAITTLAFTPDGRTLLAGTRRGVVLRFDLAR